MEEGGNQKKDLQCEVKALDGVVKSANLALLRALMEDFEFSTMDKATTDTINLILDN